MPPKKSLVARARAKVPDETLTLYRAAETMLVILEPIAKEGYQRSENTWNLVLDLRDLCCRLERRYPVLILKTRRPLDGDPSRN